MNSAAAAPQYPRPISGGGYAFPPMVEDRLPIVSAGNIRTDDDTKQRHHPDDEDETYRTDVLLVRPTDVESLWEWLAYTKSRTDADPSWGRVWPTALSLSRFVLRSVCGGCPPDESSTTDGSGGVVGRSVRSLRTSCHAIELGCGLGVAGLTYAASYADGDQRQQYRGRRTVTFLDREPHALHCAMSSCAMNGVATAGMDGNAAGGGGGDDDGRLPKIVARAAMDDWTLPVSDDGGPDEDRQGPRNVRYRDLNLNTPHMTSSYDNADTVVLASDVLYEPDGMAALASKIRGLLPERGGHALLADPARERTAGCRDAFVTAVTEAGGRVEVVPLQGAGKGGRGRAGSSTLEGDVDIDGTTLAKTVLVCVEFREETK